jgi:MFS transporter, ACS family, hexuronate transporter
MQIRWWILAALFASTVINFVDRQALSVVSPLLRDKLTLSNRELSYIQTGFMLGMLLGELPQGWLMDRRGTRLGLTFAVAWWSCANALHAFAQTLTHFVGLRFWLGTGECGNYSGGNKTVARWFPVRERALAVGVFNGGAALGNVIALPLITWILLNLGWHWVFLLPSAMGLAWAFWWWRLLGRAEREHPLVAAEVEQAPATRFLLGTRQAWGLMLCRALVGPVVQFFLFWMPEYFYRQRGMSLKEIGYSVWLPYLCGDLGSMAGGWFAGWLIARGVAVGRARAMAMSIGAVCCLGSLGIFGAATSSGAIAWICLVLFGHYFLSANMFTAISDLMPQSAVGRTTALTGIAGGLSGALFPLVAGYWIDHASFAPVFALVAVMPAFGVLALVAFNRRFALARF